MLRPLSSFCVLCTNFTDKIISFFNPLYAIFTPNLGFVRPLLGLRPEAATLPCSLVTPLLPPKHFGGDRPMLPSIHVSLRLWFRQFYFEQFKAASPLWTEAAEGCPVGDGLLNDAWLRNSH